MRFRELLAARRACHSAHITAFSLASRSGRAQFGDAAGGGGALGNEGGFDGAEGFLRGDDRGLPAFEDAVGEVGELLAQGAGADAIELGTTPAGVNSRPAAP
jgi:hypothetical protein